VVLIKIRTSGKGIGFLQCPFHIFHVEEGSEELERRGGD